MIPPHLHSVSVAAAIIDDEGRALLIQRADNGHWEPPGGVLEHGETIEEGLRREVLEETGLTIDVGPLTGIYHNLPRHIVALVFRCRTTGGQLQTSDEVTALRWESPNEIYQMADEAYAIRLLDALEPQVTTSVRTHDGRAILRR